MIQVDVVLDGGVRKPVCAVKTRERAIVIVKDLCDVNSYSDFIFMDLETGEEEKVDVIDSSVGNE